MIQTILLAGMPMNPYLPLTLAVSNVTCAMVFGHRFSSDDKTFHRMLHAMEVIFKFGGSLLHYVSKPFCFLPSSPFQRDRNQDFYVSRGDERGRCWQRVAPLNWQEVQSIEFQGLHPVLWRQHRDVYWLGSKPLCGSQFMVWLFG